MKRKLWTLLIAFIFINQGVIAQKAKKLDKDLGFEVMIASCFDNDTVTAYVNDKLVYDKIIMESDFSLGVTKSFFNQKKKANQLLVVTNGKDSYTSLPEVGQRISLKINVNRNTYTKDIDLSKGRLIFINNCNEFGYQQFKKKVLLY